METKSDVNLEEFAFDDEEFEFSDDLFMDTFMDGTSIISGSDKLLTVASKSDADVMLEKEYYAETTTKDDAKNLKKKGLKGIKKEISSEEKRKKMDHSNELLRIRRRKKLLESLKVPEDDIRRTYMHEFFRLKNSHNFKKIQEFLEKYCDSHFVYRYEEEDDIEGPTLLIPQQIEIVGIDNYVNYLKAVLTAVPDGIFLLKDVFIRKSSHKLCPCTIHATVIFEVTLLYGILLKGKNVDKSTDQNVIKKVRSSLIESQSTINLTEISHTIEKLEIKDEDQNQFERGNLLDKRVKVTGTGSMIFYLNKEHKMYMHEFKRIDKISSRIQKENQ